MVELVMVRYRTFDRFFLYYPMYVYGNGNLPCLDIDSECRYEKFTHIHIDNFCDRTRYYRSSPPKFTYKNCTSELNRPNNRRFRSHPRPYDPPANSREGHVG